MLSTLALTAITLASPGAVRDAPMKLITQHGVELRADEDVFVLFAALNAAGYSEETERKGPPLRAPVFHGIRVDVRDALRSVRKKGSMDKVRNLFEKNPGEIEDYLSATLALSSKAKLSGTPAKLKGNLPPVFDALRDEGKLVKLFDDLAIKQRNHAKELKGMLEKDFAAASSILGGTLRAPGSLVVVPNPLDGHGIVRVVDHGDTRYVVVGPGHDTARVAILRAALRSALTAPSKASFGSARGFARSWDGLKTSRRIRTEFKDGPTYLAESLTRAITHRVLSKKKSRDADEDFIDEQAKDGIRWARASLKLVDGLEKGKPIAEQLPKVVGKVTP